MRTNHCMALKLDVSADTGKHRDMPIQICKLQLNHTHLLEPDSRHPAGLELLEGFQDTR